MNRLRAIFTGRTVLWGVVLYSVVQALFAFHRPVWSTSLANILVFSVVATAIGFFVGIQVRKDGVAGLRRSWLRTGNSGIVASTVVVSFCYLAIAKTGEIESLIYPLLYGVIAFASSFAGRQFAWSALLVACALELSGPGLLHGVSRLGTLSVHLLFMAGSFVVHKLFWQTTIASLKSNREAAVLDEIERLRSVAKDFRLEAGSENEPRSEDDDEYNNLQAGAGELIGNNASGSLSLLAELLGTSRALLIWRKRGEEGAVIRGGVGADVNMNAKIPITGALTPVFRNGQVVQLDHARARQLPLGDSLDSKSAFACVPISVDGFVHGAIMLERETPFNSNEMERTTAVAGQIATLVHSERAFFATERAKYEHERFYQASAMLCRALTLEEVLSTAFKAASLICRFDFAAVTRFDPASARHSVLRTYFATDTAPICSRTRLSGLEFKDNDGLVSMVVKNKRYLPHSGEFNNKNVPVFTRSIPVRGVESLITLPLLAGGEVIGSLVLASKKTRAYGADVREMLSVIAKQVAICMQNALMYSEMETMATTDGLTGLTNHRTFKARSRELLERAARYEHQASVLLCDVDHFKSVNDTHGHPLGDEVLRRVARVLDSAVRRIDITARYGGEEFAIVLEATGHEGAINLAERIRQDVARLRIPSDKGTFAVTMSIGVASYPDHGMTLSELVLQADAALYEAKETGRNRVVSAAELGRRRAAS